MLRDGLYRSYAFTLLKSSPGGNRYTATSGLKYCPCVIMFFSPTRPAMKLMSRLILPPMNAVVLRAVRLDRLKSLLGIMPLDCTCPNETYVWLLSLPVEKLSVVVLFTPVWKKSSGL